MARFARYRTPAAVLLALALPLAVYRAHSRGRSRLNPVDRVVLEVSRPLSGALLWATSRLSSVWYNYVDLKHARAEASVLRREVARLRVAEAELRHQAGENARLLRLLRLSEDNPGARLIAARVVGAGTSLTSRVLAINRGALDDIPRGSPVVSDNGLVGIVLRVGWHTADVLLLADERLQVRARVTRSRAQGVAQGEGLREGFGLRLTELLRQDDVRPGDRVETSGWAGVFPAGIPIGEVRSVHQVKGAQNRQAALVPYVDFARVETVAVLVRPPKTPVLRTPPPFLPPGLGGPPAPSLEAP